MQYVELLDIQPRPLSFQEKSTAGKNEGFQASVWEGEKAKYIHECLEQNVIARAVGQDIFLELLVYIALDESETNTGAILQIKEDDLQNQYWQLLLFCCWDGSSIQHVMKLWRELHEDLALQRQSLKGH